MKFWPQDYDRDECLRICGLAAQGLWMRMLCQMAAASPYGHLTVNGVCPNARQLASIVGTTEREVRALLTELERAGVFSRTDTGIIYSRRMVRDKEKSDRAKVEGKTGGNPALKAKAATGDKPNGAATVNPNGYPGGLTPTLNHQDTEAEYKKQNPPVRPPLENSRVAADRGSRLPADWQPSNSDLVYAKDRVLDPARTLEAFAGYWRAKAGASARKVDWSLTWQTWCRREAEQIAPTAAAANGSRHTGSLRVGDGPQAWGIYAKGGEFDAWGTKDGVEHPCRNGEFLEITAEMVLDAAGMAPDYSGPWDALIAWMDEGIDGAALLDTVRQVAARPGFEAPSTLAYFDKAVRAGKRRA